MAASQHHPHSHDHGTHDVDWAEHAASAEAEAEVLHDLLDQSLALLSDRTQADGIDVRRIIDIGPGPGVGTCALADAFTGAEVVAVDGSDAMLARVDERATRLGLAERVKTVHAELPAGFNGLGRAEIVWASMVMHHLGNERAALAAIHSTLTPGGLVAIVEFGDPTSFLPDDAIEPHGLQDRLAAAGAEWVAHMREELPDTVVSDDYPTMLHEAGFELLTDTVVATHLDAPLSAAARKVVLKNLHRTRDIADALDPADAAAVDILLDADNPNGVMHRADVFLDGSRHLFIARSINSEGGSHD